MEPLPSYKEEEYEDASPKAPLPVPEELPPPPPEPAVVEPVGDLLVIFMLNYIFELVLAQIFPQAIPQISLLFFSFLGFYIFVPYPFSDSCL